MYQKFLDDTHVLSHFQISLCKVALLFGPISDGALNFYNASASGLKDGIQAINDLHPAGFVHAALPEVHRLSHDAAKVLATPSARVDQAFGEQQRGHFYLFSN